MIWLYIFPQETNPKNSPGPLAEEFEFLKRTEHLSQTAYVTLRIVKNRVDAFSAINSIVRVNDDEIHVALGPLGVLWHPQLEDIGERRTARALLRFVGDYPYRHAPWKKIGEDTALTASLRAKLEESIRS